MRSYGETACVLSNRNLFGVHDLSFGKVKEKALSLGRKQRKTKKRLNRRELEKSTMRSIAERMRGRLEHKGRASVSQATALRVVSRKGGVPASEVEDFLGSIGVGMKRQSQKAFEVAA